MRDAVTATIALSLAWPDGILSIPLFYKPAQPEHVEGPSGGALGFHASTSSA
jgi:hypothetical protein